MNSLMPVNPTPRFILWVMSFLHVGLCDLMPREGALISFLSPSLDHNVVSSLSGASYKIEHCSTKTKEKRHASDLSPYPIALLPLQPIDGADNQYSQIHRKFSDDPYIQVGIKGFTPPAPFRVPLHFLSADEGLGFCWPTLAELNEEIFPDI